jgi:AbrB family looped-hinge helix DNA binding protein
MLMPVKFEVSAMQVGSSIRITLPKEVREHLNVQKGDKLLMYADNSHVIIEKKKE